MYCIYKYILWHWKSTNEYYVWLSACTTYANIKTIIFWCFIIEYIWFWRLYNCMKINFDFNHFHPNQLYFCLFFSCIDSLLLLSLSSVSLPFIYFIQSFIHLLVCKMVFGNATLVHASLSLSISFAGRLEIYYIIFFMARCGVIIGLIISMRCACITHRSLFKWRIFIEFFFVFILLFLLLFGGGDDVICWFAVMLRWSVYLFEKHSAKNKMSVNHVSNSAWNIRERENHYHMHTNDYL